MQSYDLIVCGAGPAGATAAATAARAGLRVAVLEKCVFPRHKTCGGGTPMVMQDYLHNLAPEAFVESNVLYMRQTWNFGDAYLAPINPPDLEQPVASTRPISIWMVQRPVFDNALASQAVRAGADLKDGLSVRSLEIEGDWVTVRATPTGTSSSRNSEFIATAPYVIGADGANGITAKSANLRHRRSVALAMEVEYPYQWDGQSADLRPDVAHLEYAVPNGYAWTFPKADHLNVGAILFPRGRNLMPTGVNVSQELKRWILGYLDAFQLQYSLAQLKLHAHPLPIWTGKQPLQTSNGRILLAGDAAGLINPFFGDGILHAVKSGAIAANCIAEGATAEYSDRIHTEFATNFDAALNLARFFYKFPGVCYQYGVKHPQAAHLAAQLICGDLQFSNVLGRAIRRVRKGIWNRRNFVQV